MDMGPFRHVYKKSGLLRQCKSITIQLASMICLVLALLITGANCGTSDLITQFFYNGHGSPTGFALTKPCTTNDGNGNQRIVGGETSPIRYPYIVSLQMESRGELRPVLN
jgi:hypothetical protein